MSLNEFQMQKVFTRTWVREGLVLHGERHFLAAWDVATSFKINDTLLGLGKPAIDFLFLDSAGRMVALELKPSVLTPREAWAALCQVTHRAHMLAKDYTMQRLEGAYVACRSGIHGRVPLVEAVPPLWDAHGAFFDIPALASPVPLPIGRVVAAREFGESWERVLSTFTQSPRKQIARELSRYSTEGGATHEFNRWRALRGASNGVSPDVLWTTVDLSASDLRPV
jgi:hypothetical protein